MITFVLRRGEKYRRSEFSLSRTDLQTVKKALTDAGLEIYRTRDSEIQVAERVRLHIMDSGVRVRLSDTPAVTFTARSQRSDFPHDPPDALFEKVRVLVGASAEARGYTESGATTVEVKDPVDANKVLDVWHEITYTKATSDVDGVVSEVRWALELEKYISG